ncbi:hypothetical protein BGZ63DRAFT_379828 [Mariannaea sp. PMI_226]|nr:hypothetical protein BGZ63DRAFT_379828 [Mariannaea sp. PMI_226]
MALASLQLFILISLVSWASAQPGNTTNSDISDSQKLGWVSPSTRRSTWEIIWSCLSIFLVCSWKCVHLNVPTHNECVGEWHKIGPVPVFPKKPLLVKWRRKIYWMITIAIAPELGVGLAAKQFQEVRGNLKTYSDAGDDWTLVHAFYVFMGGVYMCELEEKPVVERESKSGSNGKDATAEPETTETETAKPSEKTDPTTPSRDASINLEEGDKNDSVAYQPGPYTLIKSLGPLKHGQVIPALQESEIKTLSKADAFAKVFALVQSGWLIIQCIARRAQGLAISQLELATMAFILCAVFMHLFWWHKPFGVETRHVVVRLPPNGKNLSTVPILSVNELNSDSPIRDKRVDDMSADIFMELVGDHTMILENSVAETLPSFAMYLTGIAFSAVHLAAWNWDFPSPLIQALWRWFAVAALAASAAPVVTSPLAIVASDYDDESMMFTCLAGAYSLIVLLSLVAYVAARLVILVLTFYCFTSMPESAYGKISWTGWIPHFA